MLSFEAMVMWPFALYLYFVHPDWTYMYLVDSSSLPAALVVLFLGADLLFLVGAYACGWQLLRRLGPRAAHYAVAAVGALLLLYAIAARARVLRYGSYAAFTKGQLVPLYEAKLFFTLLVGCLGAAAAAFVVGGHLQGEGRRRPAQRAPREDATSRFQPPPTLTTEPRTDDPDEA